MRFLTAIVILLVSWSPPAALEPSAITGRTVDQVPLPLPGVIIQIKSEDSSRRRYIVDKLITKGDFVWKESHRACTTWRQVSEAFGRELCATSGSSQGQPRIWAHFKCNSLHAAVQTDLFVMKFTNA